MVKRSNYSSKHEGIVTKKVIDWYAAHAFIDDAFLNLHLAKRMPTGALTAHYPAIIMAFNELVQEALLDTQWTNDRPLTFALLAARLKRSEKELPVRLNDICASQNLPPVNEAEQQVLGGLYTGWRLRIQHYVTQLDKEPRRGR